MGSLIKNSLKLVPTVQLARYPRDIFRGLCRGKKRNERKKKNARRTQSDSSSLFFFSFFSREKTRRPTNFDSSPILFLSSFSFSTSFLIFFPRENRSPILQGYTFGLDLILINFLDTELKIEIPRNERSARFDVNTRARVS